MDHEHANDDDDDGGGCPECGFDGSFDVVENPQYLWGVVGETSEVCPDCGYSNDGLE